MKYLRIAISLMLIVCAPLSAFAGSINTQEIDRRINRLMKNRDMVGLSVAIIEGGDLVFAKGYGETIKGSGQKVSADTVFRWASVSKGVAAATVMSLSKEGHFGLQSPVAAHAPSLMLPASKAVVTVEDVLTHQTGIIRNAYDRKIEDGKSAKFVRASLKGLPRICEPGECHSYQNVAYDAAAEMAEIATGMPYKAVVSERFFKPLGMETASLTLEGLVRSKDWARPHNRRGQEIRRVKNTYYRIPGAAGVNSSARDLAKWMLAQMNAGEITIPGSVKAALQMPRVATPRENRNMRRRFHALKNAHYGLGWRIYDYSGHRVIGHRGAVQGYRASVLFDPAKQTGIAVMWNSSAGRPVGLQLEVMDQAYGLPRRDWMRLSHSF